MKRPLLRVTSLTLVAGSLFLPVNALDSDCQSPTSTSVPYTGYSLKVGTGCTQYVYCQNGIVTSTTTCPGGLLFNGAVGVGGICNWASAVTCADDVAAEIAPETAGGSAAETVNTAATSTQSATVSSTPGPTPKTESTSVANPENYFCGSSYQDAVSHCTPCPSGSMKECSNFTHGCFKGVVECGSGAGAAISPSSPNFPSTPTLEMLFPSNGSSSNNNSPTAATNNFPTITNNNSPSITNSQTNLPQITGNADPSQSSAATYVPTASPSLPPWTNAPFVPYRGPKRDKTVIGYYASWQWYDRNKFADPQNIDFRKYDRINYAFFQPDKEGNIYGTDEWADPQLLWGPYEYNESNQVMSGPNRNYFCSWDGPTQRNCNYHQLDKGILSLAQSVGVEVMPSIGGWTLSDNFPTVARSEETRRHFAAQCVKLIEEYGFDGIDIDWEYPGYEDHSGTPEDTVNFTLFLQAIRDALDTLGAKRGKFYGLTAALPCGPDKIEDIQVDKISPILTELNLMSYDLHGAWDELTGINAPMFDQGWTDKTPRWSIHGCVENYVELGAPLERINVGLPFYGRSFRKATGMKQLHEGADDVNFHLDEGSPQYFNIVKELNRMTTYRHERTQTQYAVFNDRDGGIVSYDDPRAICDKVGYANDRGMHGFLIWEISGDMLDNGETPLIDATNAKIQNPSLDCSKLRDPLWAMSDTTYRYAPPEPEFVDRTASAPILKTRPAPAPPGGPQPKPAPSPSGNPGDTGNVKGDGSSSLGSQPSNDCPKDFTGYWATVDCTSYMYCQNGAVVGAAQPCVPGTLFDITIGVCTWSTNVPGC